MGPLLSVVALAALVAPALVISATAAADAAASWTILRAGNGAGRRLLQDGACDAVCQGQPKTPVCGSDNKTNDACLITCTPWVSIQYYGACKPKPCLCPPIWAPVCGGGKTYLSPCFASCAMGSRTMFIDGFCGGQCNCKASAKKPVCGLDGKTYDNACAAYCAGTQPYYSGPCDKRISTCACPYSYDPVCAAVTRVVELTNGGTDIEPFNVTFASPCLAKCQGNTTKYVRGVCPDYPVYDASQVFCGCSFEAKPVCAQSPVTKANVTVLNRCSARCSGLKVLSEGVCKDECLCPEGAGLDVCVGGTKPYKSACQARCAGERSWTVGKCAMCKSCPPLQSLDDYVCGADGTQYTSACAAECAGTRVATKGMCMPFRK